MNVLSVIHQMISDDNSCKENMSPKYVKYLGSLLVGWLIYFPLIRPALYKLVNSWPRSLKFPSILSSSVSLQAKKSS